MCAGKTLRSVSLHRVWLVIVWVNAESDSAQCYCKSARSHLFREYLRENDFFNKTILACLSGDQVGLIQEKMPTNLVTLPL